MQRDEPHMPPIGIAFVPELGVRNIKTFLSILRLPMFWKSVSTLMCLQVNASKKLPSSGAVSWVVAGCGD